MRSRIAVAAVVVLMIVVYEATMLSHKFPPYQHSVWHRDAAVLSTVAGSRIGVVLSRHGAEFVRIPTGRVVRPHLSGPEGPSIEEQMRAQLRSIPGKVAFECAWYFLLVFGFICLPVMAAVRSPRLRLAATTVGLSTFVAISLLQAPFFFGYDSSIFTTWSGPGALSWSVPPPRVTGVLGNAVSYRFTLEAVMAPALWLSAPVIAWFRDPFDVPMWVYAVAISGVYSLAGICIGALAFVAGVIHRRPPAV